MANAGDTARLPGGASPLTGSLEHENQDGGDDQTTEEA
jgi:hypothetical protein